MVAGEFTGRHLLQGGGLLRPGGERVRVRGEHASSTKMTHLCQFPGVLIHQRRVDLNLSRSEGRCSDEFKGTIAT